MKVIELSLGSSEVKAVAVLLEKEAPKTCDAFWRVLPMSHQAVHASWSGECIIVQPCGVVLETGSSGENETIFIGPGEIALFASIQELLIFYGRGQPRWRSGPTPVTVFARIVDGLGEFASECTKMTREGAKDIRVRKTELSPSRIRLS